MTSLVSFYALKDPSDKQGAAALVIEKAAGITADAVEKRIKTTVLCDTKVQAEDFDEFIWANPQERFIPHNLYGEGPDFGTPVEVIWWPAFEQSNRLRNSGLVINLSQRYLSPGASIKSIVDFVPHDEHEKAAARERYKQYKQAGCKLDYKNI